MNHSVVRWRRALRHTRWVALIIPLFLTGCFDSASASRPGKSKAGILSLSRFFSFAQPVPAGPHPESPAVSDSLSFLPAGFAETGAFENAAEFDIALPASLGGGEAGETLGTSSVAAISPGFAVSGDDPAASLLFNRSFEQLFRSLFHSNRTDDLLQASLDDFPNPFTEAREKLEQQQPEAPATTDDETEPASEKSAAETAPGKKEPAAPAGGAGAWSADTFLIVGETDESGILSVVPARRLGDNVFASDKGEMSFDLYVNSNAVRHERSFYVDDIDRDGNSDLLVTGGFSLFGAVLLGDGNGGYRIADKFLTGYQPVVAAVGPVYQDGREIVIVNMRTGFVKTYHPGDLVKPAQTQELPFVPDYLLPLTAVSDSRDHVLASTIGGIEQVFGWGADRLLHPGSEQLGVVPMILSTSFGPNTLQLFQLGGYASVLLTTEGKSFNVASMRVLPRTFLIIGDFRRDGSLDVAVGLAR